ncbi:hypothetical protein GCM10025734_13790 [Kitasatospora paranensis]
MREALPLLDPVPIEAVMRQVMAGGAPRLNHLTVGRTPADPAHDHAWSVSYFRLEDRSGRILGLATSVIDVSEQHRTAAEAASARRRLAVIARASARIGSTLDLDTTARELAEVVVPELADVAAVDVLDAVLHGAGPGLVPVAAGSGPAAFRALALAATRRSEGSARPSGPRTRPVRSRCTRPTGWSPAARRRASRSWSPGSGPATCPGSPATPGPPPSSPRPACTPTWRCR